MDIFFPLREEEYVSGIVVVSLEIDFFRKIFVLEIIYAKVEHC